MSQQAVTSPAANPAPLGLLGFGMTTILLNIHNAGFYGLNMMILGMGIFFGGIAQIIAGQREYGKGNTFAFTAFTAYGSFWISFAFMVLMGRALPDMAADALSKGWYMLVWGLFTLGMFVATLKANRALQVVFGSLVVLFGLLAGHFFSGSQALLTVAGYEGIFCGGSACYLAIAEILNEKYGRTILPI